MFAKSYALTVLRLVIFTYHVPTIQQLQEIQGRDGKTACVMDTAASEWEEVVIAMGFPAHELKTI